MYGPRPANRPAGEGGALGAWGLASPRRLQGPINYVFFVVQKIRKLRGARGERQSAGNGSGGKRKAAPAGAAPSPTSKAAKTTLLFIRLPNK